jgi:hypothetical protein
MIEVLGCVRSLFEECLRWLDFIMLEFVEVWECECVPRFCAEKQRIER